MSTFALVHGAWHGAWCWERLTPELESRGHRVIAMDLPSEDGSATFDDYADVVCGAVAEVPDDDLVLVGHSLAGQTVARAALRRAVRHLVYLCAIPPVVGHTLAQQLTDDVDVLNPEYKTGISDRDKQGRTAWVDREVATRILFDDCDDATAAAAFGRLRPQGTAGYVVPFSSAALAAAPTTYVLCSGDRLVNPQWSRRIVSERLNAELIEMPGSHSPFLSRPGDLAVVLDRLG